MGEVRGEAPGWSGDAQTSQTASRKRSPETDVVPEHWVLEAVATAGDKHVVLPLLTKDPLAPPSNVIRWGRPPVTCVDPSGSPEAIL